MNISSAKNIIKSPFFKTMIKVVIAVVVTMSLLLNLFTFVTPIVKYYGTSMTPTLSENQILLIQKTADVKNGDIIAFYYNNKVLVRRVVATGNQQISIDVFGTVSINGEEISEPYVQNKTLGQCNLKFPYNIPTNSYFVMGDNRETSMDSRLEELGTVSQDRVLGKVIFSLNPFGTIG